MDKPVAAILAAGKGTRMHPFSNSYPKPLLPVCNKPLLIYQIELFRDLGVEEIFIVIGHLGYEIVQTLGDGRDWGVKLRYVEQEEILGIAHALGQLQPYVQSPIFLALGDIFFRTENLASMMEKMASGSANAVLAVKTEEDPDAIRRNFTVTSRDDGTVSRVIEKPSIVSTNVKGCGLYLFSPSVFDVVRRTPRTAMRDEYEITHTIQLMIDDGQFVRTADVVKWDINLTFPSDVLACNLFQLECLQKNTLIGESAEIHADAQLCDVIVGACSEIVNPIKISRSVIFPGTRVTTNQDIDGFILTPEAQLDCKSAFVD